VIFDPDGTRDSPVVIVRTKTLYTANEQKGAHVDSQELIAHLLMCSIHMLDINGQSDKHLWS